jgi:hypothetical protein
MCVENFCHCDGGRICVLVPYAAGLTWANGLMYGEKDVSVLIALSHVAHTALLTKDRKTFPHVLRQHAQFGGLNKLVSQYLLFCGAPHMRLLRARTPDGSNGDNARRRLAVLLYMFMEVAKKQIFTLY